MEEVRVPKLQLQVLVETTVLRPFAPGYESVVVLVDFVGAKKIAVAVGHRMTHCQLLLVNELSVMTHLY